MCGINQISFVNDKQIEREREREKKIPSFDNRPYDLDSLTPQNFISPITPKVQICKTIKKIKLRTKSKGLK